MLTLKKIKKIYRVGAFEQEALAGVDMSFNLGEFTSILGPSGSGKTTLLNIIGGLDQYSEGDLIINGSSTKAFKDSDWDAYRNNSIGFVFQSYNLIDHISVIDNVEMSMTLSGMAKGERYIKAKSALERVGLLDHIHKKPNQLSGGQKQRVAIARALSNAPDIILADEPTGALDSVTSVEIMNLLTEISKDKLVIMVTHNRQLAEKYSNRIISLRDGRVASDTRHGIVESRDKSYRPQKTKMKLTTALKLSFNNLRTKLKRTSITAVAGSIGIIGIALVLSLSNGMSGEISSIEKNQLASMPISINEQPSLVGIGPDDTQQRQVVETTDRVIPYDPSAQVNLHKNNISEALIQALEAMPKTYYDSLQYQKSINLKLLSQSPTGTVTLLQPPKQVANQGPSSLMSASDDLMHELVNDLTALEEDYELLQGKMPQGPSDLVLILEEDYRIDGQLLEALKIPLSEGIAFEEIIGQTYVVANNDDLYVSHEGLYEINSDLNSVYHKGHEVTIVGIMRAKAHEDDSMASGINVIGPGLYYTQDFTSYILDKSMSSDIVKAQKNSDVDLLRGQKFNEFYSQSDALKALGGLGTPVAINIYPQSYENKGQIKAYIDGWNKNQPQDQRIVYTDLSEQISGAVTSIVDMIEMVLVAFAAISLLVSSIMIGIITYVSVLERTKEIGVLRSLGASKKDIKHVFYAETAIIGFFSGGLGILLTLVLSLPLNSILESSLGVANLVVVSPSQSLMLVVISTLLTLISGFIPASVAAKKNPVEALRSE